MLGRGGVTDLIPTDTGQTGVGGSNSAGFTDDGERSFSGNRWPREETLALLKIRSDMDTAFRDSSLKGPLWDGVSRKLGELGYHRNAKKCKEKFENVYKYHKRTKDGRSTKSDGKTYRFFNQLQALETQPSLPLPQTLKLPSPSQPHSFRDLLPNSPSSWSSTSSDETLDGPGDSKKRKRKWKGFFERLMRDVIEKQEALQKAFLEAIQIRERDRVAREESWRMQETARIKRDHEILLQERSVSAARDAVLISFLQKISPETPPPQPTVITPAPMPRAPRKSGDNEGAIVTVNATRGASSSRWPKAEVQALINLRTDLETKYQESGPKGALWEEISAGMSGLGYARNAKRCKEKWENINKYFKKVKESNKKRPEDSKTCPYYHQLDSLYRDKGVRIEGPSNVMSRELLVPTMVRPEQQWPLTCETNDEDHGRYDVIHGSMNSRK